MDHNLMVSFETGDPLREGALIVGAIEELGAATRVFGSTWYVCSSLPAPEAARRLWAVMDTCDVLMVVDVSHNVSAMFNVDDRSVQFMTRHWHRALEQVERASQLPHPRVAAAPALVVSTAG